MRDPKEDSLLFSLQQIETLERQRLADDRRAREAADAERRLRVEERERRARADRERAAREERERLLAEERALRQEQARLDAIHEAELERVRAEVRARTELEMAEARRRSELEIEEVRALASRQRCRWLLGASVTTTCVAGAMAAVLSEQVRGIEAADARRAATVAADLRDCDRARVDLDATRQRVDSLERQIRAAGSGTALPSVALTPKKPIRPPNGAKSSLPKTPANSRGARACTGDGDPLNGCLPP